MLWAIDVGNTQTLFAVHNGKDWVGSWRFETRHERTEDELAGLISELVHLNGVEFKADSVVIASVVPQIDQTLTWFCKKHLKLDPLFLKNGAQVGMKVTYDPPHSVGADRIANALGALERVQPPFVVVDFGTATTLDVVDKEGSYIGGSILPGIVVSMESLVGKTAKLPGISIQAPERAIGRNTTESLQSGIVLGYAGAIDCLVKKVSAELGGEVSVLSTGGLGSVFVDLCETIDHHEPMLTMDGLLIAEARLKN